MEFASFISRQVCYFFFPSFRLNTVATVQLLYSRVHVNYDRYCPIIHCYFQNFAIRKIMGKDILSFSLYAYQNILFYFQTNTLMHLCNLHQNCILLLTVLVIYIFSLFSRYFASKNITIKSHFMCVCVACVCCVCV